MVESWPHGIILALFNPGMLRPCTTKNIVSMSNNLKNIKFAHLLFNMMLRDPREEAMVMQAQML